MYKSTILFALMVLVFAGCSNAVYETISPAKYHGIKPQEGDNSIIIMSDLDSEALFQKINKGLLHHGFGIQHNDRKALIINSGWKTFAHEVHIKVNASIHEYRQGSIARINGLWMNADQQNELERQDGGIVIEYSEQSSSWDGLHNFATSIFDLEQITYE